MNFYPTVNRVAFKESVRMTEACLDPCMVELLCVVMRTAPPLGGDTLVVTSANDSTHSVGSLHYVGRAFDIRYLGQRAGGIVGILPQKPAAEEWAARIRQQLPPGYDIVVEADHIHAERDVTSGR